MTFTPENTCDVTIDVSHWQGEIDWPAVKAAGIVCAMIKATQGTTTDPKWLANWEGARAAGILVIPYLFLDKAAKSDEEANYFALQAALEKGRPYALDWEIGGMTDPQAVEWIGKHLTERFGRYPLGYWGIYPPGLPTPTMRLWPRWIPRYGDNSGEPNWKLQPKGPWLFWQYTSNREIDGITGKVDASLFAGTVDELEAWHKTGLEPGALT